MRKLSRSLAAKARSDAGREDEANELPGRISGATITSWPSTTTIDLTALLARPTGATSISGSSRITHVKAPAVADGGTAETLALSDGTRISFTTAGQFTILELV